MSCCTLRVVLLFCFGTAIVNAADFHWVATWATAPQLVEPGNLPPAPGFTDCTLRQKLRISIGGEKIRLRFSNAFGNAPLTLEAAQVALAADGAGIRPETSRQLAFNGVPAVTIQPGAIVISDPVDLKLSPLADLAVTLHTKNAPSDVTGHPGSRTTSYLAHGSETVDASDLPGAARTDHWYFLTGIDVYTEQPAAAIAVLGDSITDGRGSTTNGNDRWPDQLSRRLRANPETENFSVLNLGIGGGRILRYGLGPSGLARLDRDVIAQPGVKWLVVFEGVNDLGTAVGARAKGQPENGASAADLIAAFDQIILRAHDHGIRVYGATITPFAGFKSYDTPASEADRQKVNQWIRTSGKFDSVIDFDAIARDPKNPLHLAPAIDGGDHLHPSAAGYKIMAENIDLALFR
ncbi:MAG TPA: SGNH/GDSL hydrolase family protein [Lacunisphaera sp.]|jgi:lysophospholipase L1-like esterase